MSNALLVPDNSKNLVSVSTPRAADDELLFGKDLEIRTENEVIFPFEDHDSLLHWKTTNSTVSENRNLDSGDRLCSWHKRLGQYY